MIWRGGNRTIGMVVVGFLSCLFWSCELDSFLVLRGAPLVVSPSCSGHHVVAGQHLDLEWARSYGADGVVYDIVMNGDVVAEGITGDRVRVLVPRPVGDRLIGSWYVRSRSDFQVVGGTTCALWYYPSFRLESSVSRLCDPGQSSEISLSWRVMGDARDLAIGLFRVEMATDSTFSEILFRREADRSPVRAAVDFGMNDFLHARVQAKIDGEWSPISNVIPVNTAGVCGTMTVPDAFESRTDPVRGGYPSVAGASSSRISFSDCQWGLYGVTWVDTLCGDGDRDQTDVSVRFASITASGKVYAPPITLYEYEIEGNYCTRASGGEFYSFLSSLVYDGENFGLVFAAGSDGLWFAQISPGGKLAYPPVRINLARGDRAGFGVRPRSIRGGMGGLAIV